VGKLLIKIRSWFKAFLIDGLYKYVTNNPVIQEDIIQTYSVSEGDKPQSSLKAKFTLLMMSNPEFAYIFFSRIKRQEFYWKHLFTQEYVCEIYNIEAISGGLICYHPFSTVINAKSIGKNFQFRNSITIGNKGNDNSLLPIIGDNVIVGANAVIIGDITVGDNVIIGAGAIVVKDVPSNVVIAGNPAKVIKENK